MRTAHQGDIVAAQTGAAHAPQTPAPARRRPLLWAAIAVPAIAWTALYAGAAQPLTGTLERRASEALGRDVTIGGNFRVLVTPFSVYLTAGDVRIANPRWAMDDVLFSAQTVTARLSTFDLLIGRHGFRALDVRGGTLDLERSRHSGKVNWRVGKAGTLFDIASVQQLDADDLTIRYRDFGADIDTRLALASTGRGAIAFSGAGKIGERAFTLRGTSQSADDQPTTFDIGARTGGIELGLQGTADGPLRLARADLTASAKGGDFSELAAFAGISLPAMPGYDLKAQLGHAPNAWHFGRIEGRIGRTDLSGKLTLDQRRARPRIVAQLASRSLDMRDGMTLLGLRTDPPPIDMAYAGLPVTQRLLPDAALSSAALRRFDAVIDYEADRVTGVAQAPTQLSLKLALVKGVLTLSPVTIDLAGGFVSSDIMIDGRQSPALARYDIRLSPTPMGRLLAQWGVAPIGTTAMAKGRIELTGRGETLRETFANASGRIALIIPQGQLRTQRASASGLDLANLNAAIFRDAQLGAAQVNCGLIAFTVRDGLASADPILIDTAGNLLSGHGRIDLRDETIDLRLSADGKSFAFLNRPIPVRVGGTFADPLVTREPISWFRPGSIFGLTMNLPNLGAIFSFVDPGDARDAACGPVLRGAPGSAQRERTDELANLR
jgi:uncharacterized protein involved in outer membrane biogenesis